MQTVLVMSLIEPHVLKLTKALKSHFEQHVMNFDNTPLLLDLSLIENSQKWIDFPAVTALLSNYGLQVIGVRGGNDQQKAQARAARLAIFDGQIKDLAAMVTPTTEPAPQAMSELTPQPSPEPQVRVEYVKVLNPPMVIRHPVRSGTEPYAHASDLIVEGPVSPGARVMADGSIYIHGPLRGSACAGARGLTGARIFCEVFEPEIVAINGVYLPAERLSETPAWGKRAVVEMNEDGKLSIRAMA